MPTSYVDLDVLSKSERTVMQFIQSWVETEKTPVPKQEILKKVRLTGIKDITITVAICSLIRKGFLRRAFTTSNKASYVQLGRI